MDLRQVGWGGAQTGSIWLRIGTGGAYEEEERCINGFGV
jgi:hypothetical protein